MPTGLRGDGDIEEGGGRGVEADRRPQAGNGSRLGKDVTDAALHIPCERTAGAYDQIKLLTLILEQPVDLHSA